MFHLKVVNESDFKNVDTDTSQIMDNARRVYSSLNSDWDCLCFYCNNKVIIKH